MNQYTELLRHIKSTLEDDGMVNTITQGNWYRIDLNKGVVYPIVHVQFNSANFTNGQVIRFNIQIGCYQQRDDNREVNNQTGVDRFYRNDNEVDNMNETLSILNRLWLKLNTDYASVNIKASDDPELVPDYEARIDTLDGWVMTFDVEVPNTDISICVDPV